ncbi:MAG: ATPase, partial [Synergistales bacterium]|nr:ATPase [Synergistales bacterium]
MAVVPMASLSMVGPKDEVLGVARRLLLRGCFQPVPIDSVVDDREMRSALDTSGENPWEGLLAEMESLWETAGERPPLPDPARSGDLPSYEEIRGRVAALTEKLSAWERRRRELTAEVEQLEAARIFAEALEEAHIPLEAAAGGGILGIYTGSVTREDYDRLEDISAEVPLLVVPLARPGGHVWVMALTVSGYAEGAEQLLDSVSFRRFALGELLGGMGKDWRGEIQRRLDHHGRAIEGLAGAAEGYLERNRAGLERLYGQIYCMERVQEVCRRRGEMDDLYVVSGWLPADETEEVERMVDAEAPGTVIIAGSRPRTGGSRVPVFLRNLPGVRFFQDIVALYSTPAYTESDPSFFVAVTFCLFFGFMFGDIAHGLMLVAAAVLLRKTGILSRAFGAVLTLAGLSSTLFGVLYGSVFGDEHLIPGLWLSPMEDMGLLIQSALLLGIGVISAGMVMNTPRRYRRGVWGRLHCDIRGVAGLLLYWLAVVLAWAWLS